MYVYTNIVVSGQSMAHSVGNATLPHPAYSIWCRYCACASKNDAPRVLDFTDIIKGNLCVSLSHGMLFRSIYVPHAQHFERSIFQNTVNYQGEFQTHTNIFLLLSYGFLIVLKWCSFGFLIELLGFPLVSPWFPIALLCIVCLLCSNRFLLAFQLLSNGVPDVSRSCSYDFLLFSNMCFLWFPIVFILPSH